MEKDFEQELKINRFKLDEECEKQANIYYYYANQAADARKAEGIAADALKLIRAQRAVFIRCEREDRGEKTTEAMISAAVDLDEMVLAAQTKLRTAAYNLDVIEAAVTALDHRKRQLDNLVQLFCKSYYSAPDGGRDFSAAQNKANVRGQLNKKDGEDK